jgi:glycosyltransferase involved in cell wall biosynthesis
MPKLSAFLIVKNEAVDLPGCLESLLGLADEIIVVDSGSTDATVPIAEACGARTFTRDFDGFATQKQFSLDHCTGDWVLSIDADERVTPELAADIRRVLNDSDAADGYRVRRDLYFLGRRLRHGGVGTDWPLRFFRHTKGAFANVTVHESVDVSGSVGRLDGVLKHLSYATLAEYAEKCEHYTTLSAEELFKKGRRFSTLDHLRPGWELFQRVILRGAWLDGQVGLIYAALSSHTVWLRAVKLWELEHRR